MSFAPDSTQAGYLGPVGTQPLEDRAWENWLAGVFGGITGLDPQLVRPRWQQEPPNRPEIDIDWLAFGIVDKRNDFTPAIIHVDDGGQGGYDALQEHEIDTVLCSFYGPNGERNASYLRRGFFIDQNRAACRAAHVGLVDIEDIRNAPEFFNQRWWARTDMNVVLRREIRLDYPVRTLLRSHGLIHANDFGEERIVEKDWDTDRVEHPAFYK